MSEKFKRITFDAIRDSAIEFLLLYGVWLLFVSQLKIGELLAGIPAALLGAVGDAVLKAEGYAKFKPRLSWIPLIFAEVWYTIDGTWAILLALGKRIAGKESEAEFKVITMPAAGKGAEAWARRTLMIAYMTIPPNFIIVGIDAKTDKVLVHQVSPTGVPWIAKQLGARDAA